jgi:hypothetical protein
MRCLRPVQSWDKVTATVNAALSAGRPRFSRGRLVHTVRTLVAEGMAKARLLDAAPKTGRKRQPSTHRLMQLADIAA